MSGPSSGEFAHVARVMFGNAARNGIVSAESKHEYVKELGRLAVRSKKKGGSLGGVKLKMAEFVGREVRPIPLPRKPNVTVAKVVPMIDISTASKPSTGTDAKKPESLLQQAKKQQVPRDTPSIFATLQLTIPGLKQRGATQAAQTRSPSTITDAAAVPSARSEHSPADAPQKAPKRSTSLWDETVSHLGASSSMSTADARKSESVHEAQQKTSSTKAPRNIEIAEEVDVLSSMSRRAPAETKTPSESAEVRPSVVQFEPRAPLVSPAPPAPQVRLDSTSPSTAAASPISPSTDGALSSNSSHWTASFDAPSPAAPSVDDTSLDFSNLSSGSFSVDAWEQQRERELMQMQEAQREHDAKLAEAAERERLRILGDEWAQSRMVVTSKQTADARNEAMFFAKSWESALRCLSPEADITEYSMIQLARRLKKAPSDVVQDTFNWIETTVNAKKNKNSAALLELARELRTRSASTFAARPKPLPTSSHALLSLDRTKSTKSQLFLRSLQDAAASDWAKAVQMIQESLNDRGDLVSEVGTEENASSSGDAAERRIRHKNASRMLRSTVRIMSRCGELPPIVRRSLAQELYEMARKSHPERKTERKMALDLASMSKGFAARGFLPPLDANADEEILAAHIRSAADDEAATQLLTDGKALGLNASDPHVVGALAQRAAFSPTPGAAIAILNEHLDNGGFVGSGGIRAAVLSASVANTAEAAKETYEFIARACHPSLLPLATKRMMPLLFAHKLFPEMVSLHELGRSHFSIENSFPNCTLLLNSALKACGKEPLSDKDASSLPPMRLRGDRGGKSADSDGDGSGAVSGSRSENGTASLESIISTDEMLEYAKGREWSKALAALEKLPSTIPRGQEQSATLLFNCALSAAAEHPEVVTSILKTMKDRNVEQNVTTYNTAMSSYAKSDSMWATSIDIFQSMNAATRDASSYAVLLSVLGKTQQWSAAIEAFQDMKKTPSLSKPTSVLYGLAIGATYKHQWSATLQLFQEMVKAHGASNIKEVVTMRVLKCLEDNQRMVELQRVERELEKAKSKKGGKKK